MDFFRLNIEGKESDVTIWYSINVYVGETVWRVTVLLHYFVLCSLVRTGVSSLSSLCFSGDLRKTNIAYGLNDS